MDKTFDIEIGLLNKKGTVKESSYFLTTITENSPLVTVDRLPLIEYFVEIGPASVNKNDQIKAKVYRTVSDGKWFDQSYSEDATFQTPEFGIPEINKEIKKAIDDYEFHSVSKTKYSA